jgi:hypothetical protein
MPPNTLFRRDTKQAVNISVASDEAKPQTKQELSEPDAQPKAPANIQKIPVSAPARRKTASLFPGKSLRAKVTVTAPAKPAVQASAPIPSPNLTVWGEDSALKNRIEQLKIRNAQLAEQLQRLASSAKA